MGVLVVTVFIFVYIHLFIFFITKYLLILSPIEQHFSSSAMTLSDRFTMYQRLAAEKEIMKPRRSPEIHRYWFLLLIILTLNIQFISVLRNCSSLNICLKIYKKSKCFKNFQTFFFWPFFTGELMFLPVLLWGTHSCLMSWKDPGKAAPRWQNILKYAMFRKKMLQEWASQNIFRNPPLSVSMPLLFSCKKDISSLLSESEMWKWAHSVNCVVISLNNWWVCFTSLPKAVESRNEKS